MYETLNKTHQRIADIFDKHLGKLPDTSDHWIDQQWHGDHIRRAHLTVIDEINTRGVWVMHVCVFPKYHNGGPIYGFDIVAGKRKITGVFHDFSPGVLGTYHHMHSHFKDSVERIQFGTSRTLPDWAVNIFSEHCLAVGNISSEKELSTIVDISVDNLEYYMLNIHKLSSTVETSASKYAYNYYCIQQKQNPHTPRMLENLGLTEQQAQDYFDCVLFPEHR